ncbi:MAG: protein kinase, partial [Planctomycetota bacterium]
MNGDRFQNVDAILESYEAVLRNNGAPALTDYLKVVDPGDRRELFRRLITLERELLTEESWLERRRELLSFPAFAEWIVDFDGPVLFDETEIGSSTHPDNAGAREEGVVDECFGPFRLVELIGKGGMGAVYRAQQTEPVRRDVAIKLIRSGFDSQETRARFEAERQALALMDHPCIAKILDAGTTEAGQLYFAMEWVQGVPLTVYCDEKRLPIEERLELFIQVCDAVQHAHQKGIIHRDLKPSNILVADYEGKPVPKVIDFGLAKALHSESLTCDGSEFTQIGQIIGTYKYMSPEQAGLNNLDIDTRTDIYSLGVILYEQLVGELPLKEESYRGRSLIEVLELIRHQDTQRPSLRMSSIADERKQAVVASRRIDGRKLSRELSGDLDWIAMKALEKDRDRRYDSAASFARDIGRYLSGDAVSARPPAARYRIRKFIRKRKAAVISAIGVGAALLVAMVGIAVFAVQARNSERLALASEARAKANRQQALNAVEEFFISVSEEKLLNVPGLQGLREELLGNATNFYDQLLDNEQVGSTQTRVASKLRYAS